MLPSKVMIIALVCVVLVCVPLVSGGHCSCSCCVGFDCKLIQRAVFQIASCNTETCVEKCQATYLHYCNGNPFATSSVCISGASHLFSRFTTLTATILALLAIFGAKA